MRRLFNIRFGFRVVGFVAVLSMLLGTASASSSSYDAFVAGGVDGQPPSRRP